VTGRSVRNRFGVACIQDLPGPVPVANAPEGLPFVPRHTPDEPRFGATEVKTDDLRLDRQDKLEPFIVKAVAGFRKFCRRNPLDARISHQRRGPQSAEPAAGTLTIALFLLNLRRTSERAGRFAERHQASETTPDIRRQMLDAALMTATLSVGACPPMPA